MRAVLMYAFFVIVSMLMISFYQDDNEPSKVEDATCLAISYNIECVIPEIDFTKAKLFFRSNLCQSITTKYFEATQKDSLVETALKIYIKNTIGIKPLYRTPFRKKILSLSAAEDYYPLA